MKLIHGVFISENYDACTTGLEALRLVAFLQHIDERINTTDFFCTFYSDRSEFTGFVVAALIDSKLTVSHAIISADRNAIRNIVQSIVT